LIAQHLASLGLTVSLWYAIVGVWISYLGWGGAIYEMSLPNIDI
jgi:hypothetical protein